MVFLTAKKKLAMIHGDHFIEEKKTLINNSQYIEAMTAG